MDGVIVAMDSPMSSSFWIDLVDIQEEEDNYNIEGEFCKMHLLGSTKVLIHGNTQKMLKERVGEPQEFEAQFKKLFGKDRNLDHRLYIGSPSQ
jgi:hypothetical protein